ncbi:MAG TPA: peptidyl-prolyl cis-trans isomerase [Myxococcota bacterium]|nr:peptidyl-prolyl cis-trans isomerase [Myxococcota bacterium]
MSPQGKRRKPPPPARNVRAERGSHKLAALAVFAIFVVGSLIVVAAAQGLGGPSVPEGDIAVIEDAPDGTITSEDFDSALEQTAARQGLREVPPPDDPQYELLVDAAVSDLILSRWVLGEAEERGIEATDREIDEELDTVINQQFGSQNAFEKFLDQSGFTQEEARERIALQLVSDRIQQAVLPQEPEITEDQLRTYYDENITQFEQPEARDVRVILTKNEADAEEAAAALAEDSSPQSFKEVAKEFSIDEATQSTGGLREAVVQGQSEPALDEQIFSAPEGELVGPFESDQGFYVIQVESITPAQTTTFDEAREQIQQTLVAARQQELAQSFQEDFQAKWTARTVCADDYRIDRCSNAESPPDPCTEEVAETQGCDAPVVSTRPIAPGTAGVFGAPAPTGLPQGPISPAPPTPPGGVPPGLIPGAPPGTVPPGTAPPGTAPPGAAPPGAAPPGAPPPGAVPPG